MIADILIFISAAAVCIDLGMFLLWDESKSSGIMKPKVSVLVAARNEEENIFKCLNALVKVDYPPQLVEVLIGNDGSEDRTGTIAKEFALIHPRFSVIEIDSIIAHRNCKGNVIAHLARKAKGDLLLITDADAMVPSQWINNHVATFRPGIGIITGVTIVTGNKWFERCQRYDWIYGLGAVKVASGFGDAITTLGNNMTINKRAYDDLGGYENLPFSITEDRELLKHLMDRGYVTEQLFDANSVVRTVGMGTISELLQQRKRWMIGAFELSFRYKLLLLLNTIYILPMFALVFYQPLVAIALLLSKILAKGFFLTRTARLIREKVPVADIFLFEAYHTVVSLMSLVFYLLPIKVVWKGRKY